VDPWVSALTVECFSEGSDALRTDEAVQTLPSALFEKAA
jgi:hypothetical protein